MKPKWKRWMNVQHIKTGRTGFIYGAGPGRGRDRFDNPLYLHVAWKGWSGAPSCLIAYGLGDAVGLEQSGLPGHQTWL